MERDKKKQRILPRVICMTIVQRGILETHTFIPALSIYLFMDFLAILEFVNILYNNINRRARNGL